jgi:hypothetical protein
MRFVITLAALSLVAAPILADPAVPAYRAGQSVHDASDHSVGIVNRVNPDGSVEIIYNSQFVILPAASLSMTNGVIKTTLTRKQLNQL